MKAFKFNPVKKVIQKLQSIRENPMKICYGFAFGVFMAATPFIGFKWLVALPIVMIFKLNKTACLLGILQVNYLTGPFFYALVYFVGNFVCGYQGAFALPERMNLSALKMIFFENTEVFISLLTGGLILGIPMALGSFFLIRSLLFKKLQPQFA